MLFSVVFNINCCLSLLKLLDLINAFKRYKQKYAVGTPFFNHPVYVIDSYSDTFTDAVRLSTARVCGKL